MSRPTAHLIHGFNVSDYGASGIGQLAPHFEAAGFRASVVGYPWTWLLTLRARNRAVADRLLEQLRPGDVMVAHSNGAAIADLAAREYDRVDELGAIYINPALPREQPVPPALSWLHVLYAPSDQPVRWASRLRRWTAWLPWQEHPWGAMGAYGYRGDDPRVTQANIDEQAARPLKHGGVLQRPKVDRFGHAMATFAEWQNSMTRRGAAVQGS